MIGRIFVKSHEDVFVKFGALRSHLVNVQDSSMTWGRIICHSAIRNGSSDVQRCEKGIIVWEARALIEADTDILGKKAGSELLPSELSAT
jgi:hypothetical protein